MHTVLSEKSPDIFLNNPKEIKKIKGVLLSDKILFVVTEQVMPYIWTCYI